MKKKKTNKQIIESFVLIENKIYRANTNWTKRKSLELNMMNLSNWDQIDRITLAIHINTSIDR